MNVIMEVVPSWLVWAGGGGHSVGVPLGFVTLFPVGPPTHSVHVTQSADHVIFVQSDCS